MQAVNFIGCLNKLKFRLLGLSWTQPRKRKESVNLKERKRMPVKKIWNLREERPCAISLRNYEWHRWVERWESENFFFFFFFFCFFFFFFLFQSGMHLPAETVVFCQYGEYTAGMVGTRPVWSVFFPVRNFYRSLPILSYPIPCVFFWYLGWPV